MVGNKRISSFFQPHCRCISAACRRGVSVREIMLQISARSPDVWVYSVPLHRSGYHFSNLNTNHAACTAASDCTSNYTRREFNNGSPQSSQQYFPVFLRTLFRHLYHTVLYRKNTTYCNYYCRQSPDISPGFTGVLRIIPESSVLIETDRNTPTGAGEELMRVCGAIAEAKGFSIEEAIALANRNARRFLSAMGKLPRLSLLGRPFQP